MLASIAGLFRRSENTAPENPDPSVLPAELAATEALEQEQEHRSLREISDSMLNISASSESLDASQISQEDHREMTRASTEEALNVAASMKADSGIKKLLLKLAKPSLTKAAELAPKLEENIANIMKESPDKRLSGVKVMHSIFALVQEKRAGINPLPETATDQEIEEAMGESFIGCEFPSEALIREGEFTETELATITKKLMQKGVLDTQLKIKFTCLKSPTELNSKLTKAVLKLNIPKAKKKALLNRLIENQKTVSNTLTHPDKKAAINQWRINEFQMKKCLRSAGELREDDSPSTEALIKKWNTHTRNRLKSPMNRLIDKLSRNKLFSWITKKIAGSKIEKMPDEIAFKAKQELIKNITKHIDKFTDPASPKLERAIAKEIISTTNNKTPSRLRVVEQSPPNPLIKISPEYALKWAVTEAINRGRNEFPATLIDKFADEDMTFEEKFGLIKSQFIALAESANLILTQFEIVPDENGNPKSIVFDLSNNASYFSTRRLSYPITLLKAAADEAFETSPFGKLEGSPIWDALNQLSAKNAPLEFDIPIAAFLSIEDPDIREDFIKFFHDTLYKNGHQLEHVDTPNVFHFSKYETQTERDIRLSQPQLAENEMVQEMKRGTGDLFANALNGPLVIMRVDQTPKVRRGAEKAVSKLIKSMHAKTADFNLKEKVEKKLKALQEAGAEDSEAPQEAEESSGPHTLTEVKGRLKAFTQQDRAPLLIQEISAAKAQMNPNSWTLSLANQAISWVTGSGSVVYDQVIFPVIGNALTDILDIIDSPEFDFILHQTITDLIEDTI